jgi:hypothetical protein
MVLSLNYYGSARFEPLPILAGKFMESLCIVSESNSILSCIEKGYNYRKQDTGLERINTLLQLHCPADLHADFRSAISDHVFLSNLNHIPVSQPPVVIASEK